jgi:hypothetical protein
VLIISCSSEKESEMKIKFGDKVWSTNNSVYIFKNNLDTGKIIINAYMDKMDKEAPNVVISLEDKVGTFEQPSDSLGFFKYGTPYVAYLEKQSDFFFANNAPVARLLSVKGTKVEISKIDLENNIISFKIKTKVFDSKSKFVDSIATPNEIDLEIVAKNVKCLE